MKTGIKVRLSVMMFMQFFIWGGWFVTLGSYLAANLTVTGAQTSMAFSTQSWGAIIAPFIVGLLADRYFNAERLLGLIHLIGAAPTVYARTNSQLRRVLSGFAPLYDLIHANPRTGKRNCFSSNGRSINAFFEDSHLGNNRMDYCRIGH
jgi:MFS family permease